MEDETSDVPKKSDASDSSVVAASGRKRRKKCIASPENDVEKYSSIINDLKKENAKLKEQIMRFLKYVRENEAKKKADPCHATKGHASDIQLIANAEENEELVESGAESARDKEFPQLKPIRKKVASTTDSPVASTSRAAQVQQAAAPQKKTKNLPPAIMAYNLHQKEAVNKLSQVLRHKNFSFNILNRNVTKIELCTMADYISTKEWLGQRQTNYYTFTPSELKPYSVLINKLSHTYDEEEVLEYLNELGGSIKVLKCKKWGNTKWLIQLGRESDMKTFYNIKNILNCKVTFSKFESKGPVQCKNCQRLNHVASNCKMPYRCVKCGESHGPNNCPIPPKELNTKEVVVTSPVSGKVTKRIGLQVRCVNCGTEGHTANAKICPKRQEIVQRSLKRQATKAATNPQNNNRSLPPSNPVSKQQTFASLLKPKPISRQNPIHHPSVTTQPQPPTSKNVANEFSAPNTHFNFLDSECKRLLGKDFAESLQKIGEFSVHYRTLTDDRQKSNALFSLLISLRLE